MSDLYDDQTPPSPPPPDPPFPNPDKPFAFCQNCGRPLDPTSARVVGQAVFCEPCLAARLAGTPSAGPGSVAGYTPVNAAGAPPDPGAPWPPAASGQPNPGLAALLGLMPGVGAMYNEQYAKGIVHLFVFAVLVSFTHVNDVFLIFVFGWIGYMAIEAHHTAKARRDGTPLPNPFGLNDIGERLGFNTAFTTGPSVVEVARDAARAAAQTFHPAGSQPPGYPPPAAAGYGTTPPPPPSSATGSAPWGAPTDQYAYTTQQYAQNYAQNMTADIHEQARRDAFGSVPPYAPPYVPVQPMPVAPVPMPSRFPAGAVWLIALGTIFLLGTTGIFHVIRGQVVVGFALIALGAWIFVRRMTEFGQALADDGTPGYQFRIRRALSPAVWFVLFGALTLLDTFGLVRWGYSWPWIIILAGLLMILDRAMLNSAAAAAAYSPYPTSNPVSTPAPEPAPTKPFRPDDPAAPHQGGL